MTSRGLARLSPSWLFLALGLCCWSASAAADTTEPAGAGAEVAQAEQYAAQAFEAYRNKDYPNAVAFYHKAYELSASADLLYNIARVYDLGIRDRQLATNFYRRYVSDSGAVPERIEKATRRLEELRAAERALAVEPAPREQSETVSASAPAASEDTPRTNFWSTFRIAGLASGIAGLAALGVGTAYGLRAISEVDTAHAECDGNQCRSQRGVDAANAAQHSAGVTTLALSVGAGLALTGATLWFFGPEERLEAPGAQARVRWVPIASTSQLGVELSGGW